MAAMKSQCVGVLCRLSDASHSNEDSSSFKNSCTGLQSLGSLEMKPKCQLIHQLRPCKVAGAVVLPVVFLVVFPTTKRSPSFHFIIFRTVKVRIPVSCEKKG